MLCHLPGIPMHPLLVVCLHGNSLLKCTHVIQLDLSYYFPDWSKEVLFSYCELFSLSVTMSGPRLLRRGKLTSSIGPTIQRGRRNTSSSSALDRPSASYDWILWPSLNSFKFNMRCHWEAEFWASNVAQTSSAKKNDAIDRLSGNLQKTTSFFREQTAEADKILRDSYQVQCNDELKANFYNSSPLPFFRDIALPSRNFPKNIAHVQRIVAIFGGT